MSKPKLLWLSDILTKSGFGVVAENNLKYLQVKYDIAAAGWNFDPRQQYRRPWNIYYVPKNINPQMGITMSGIMDSLVTAIQKENPDVLMCYADPWDFPYVSDEFYIEGQVYNGLKRLFPNLRIVGHLTADAYPLPSYIRRQLMFYDAISVPSEFSKKALQLLIPNTPIDVIYHGHDQDIFKKIHPNALQEFKGQLGLRGEFVVGFNGRNQNRKNIPGLLRAFKKFNTKCPNSKLLLMTEIDSPHAVNQLRYIIDRMGLGTHIIIPQNFGPKGNVSDEQMAMYYNCMDVYCSLAMAEGFGLPILEAMACGVPVVHTNYSAPVELIENSQGGLLVDVGGWINENMFDRNFAIADEDHAAGLLQYLYENPEQRKILGNNARLWASKETWLHSAKQFDEFISKALNKPTLQKVPMVFSREVFDKEGVI